jgi:hypothetical protein
VLRYSGLTERLADQDVPKICGVFRCFGMNKIQDLDSHLDNIFVYSLKNDKLQACGSKEP